MQTILFYIPNISIFFKKIFVNQKTEYFQLYLHNIKQIDYERMKNMLSTLSDKIREHIRSNLISYVLLLVFFTVGIACGAYIFKSYNAEEISSLQMFYGDAVSLYKDNSVEYTGIFKACLLNSVKTVFFIWILGFTVIGIPVVFFMIIKTGFMLGFIANFLISAYSFNGIWMTILITVMQAVIYIPLIFAVATYSVSLSKTLTQMLVGKIKYKVNFKYYILSYMIVLAVAVVVAVIYSLSESYFTGNLLKWYFSLQ